MDNMEVIVFVDKFKEKCDDCIQNYKYPATCENSSIARMLCEEARYR